MKLPLPSIVASLALLVGLAIGSARAETASAAPAMSSRAEPLPLTLAHAQAQALAVERNHELKLARAALAQAEAGVQSAGAAPNPVLGLSSSGIGAGAGAGSLWRKSIDTVLSVSQLIERGNKRELRTESAQHEADAAGADLQDVQRQLRLQVARAYADLMAAQDKLAASTDASNLMDAALAVAQKRRAAGDVAGADVERVRVDALRARNEVALAQGELGRARQALALLLGQTAHADALQAVDAWPAAEAALLPDDAALARIIDARADVRAARARVDAALSGTRLADALRTRDLTVGAQLEHYPQGPLAGTGSGSGVSGNSIGFSISMPLFTRYYYQGEIAASQAALDAAETLLERTRERALVEVRSARIALDSAAERVRRNRDDLLVAAEKAARAAEYAYQNGAVSVTDVLDARRTLRATRLDALAAQAEFSKALAAWQAAMEVTAAAPLSPVKP